MQTYESESDDTPLVWRLAFDAARNPHTHAMQNLILGVNAHINFDLEDQLGPEWSHLSGEQRQLSYRDHCRVNEPISQTIDIV